MDLKSKVVTVTAKTVVSGEEGVGEKTGVVTRVVDNNRIAVTIPVSVPARPESVRQSFAPARGCDLVGLLLQNYSNFKQSDEPARLMRYVDGSWVDVEEDVFEAVRAGFLKGISTVETEIGGSKCLFDLHRMIELNLNTEDFRSVAWIDVQGMCFFPKSFVCSHGKNDLVNSGEESKNEVVGNANETRYLVQPKLEIEIKIANDSQKEANNLNDNEVKANKRRREINEPQGSSSNFPPKNIHVEDCELISPRWPKSKLLGEQEDGYRIVRNLFFQGMTAVEPVAAITAVHQRVKRGGPMERAEYDAFQKQIESMRHARGGNANVVFAWFGTTAKAVETIMNYGFGATGVVPYFGAPGVGLYFSPARTPRMSALMAQVDENGEKHVILCRLILGKCEKIEIGSLQLSHSRMDFDTGVDDVKDPQWFGVWGANMNARALPECVISYRPAPPANRVPGPVTAVSTHKLAPNAAPAFYQELITKLKRSLPPPKVHQLQALYRSLVDGTLGKDAFMKEVGSVVGDEVLRSAIQQIRG